MKHLLQEASLSRPKSKRRKGSDVFSCLNIKYRGLASKLLNANAKCCADETNEIRSCDAFNENKWIRRAHIVEQDEVMVSTRLMVALYPGDPKVSSRKYFTASFENKLEFTESIVTEKVRKEC